MSRSEIEAIAEALGTTPEMVESDAYGPEIAKAACQACGLPIPKRAFHVDPRLDNAQYFE